MKITLDKIFEDIKKGENIDLYSTLIIAFLTILLSFYPDLVGKDRIFQVLLALLVFLIISLIKNRYLLNEILSKLAKRGEIIERFPKQLIDDIERAKEIWLTGIHHSSFMTDYHDSLIKMLSSDGILKVIVVPPQGNAIRMTSMRFPGKIDPKQESKRTEENLRLFFQLKKKYPKNIYIRTLDYLFEYSCIFINPNHSDSIAYIQRYTFKTHGGARKPKLILRPSSGAMFNLIRTELSLFWECAEDINNEK